MFFSSIKEINRILKEINTKLKNVKYLLKSYYSEKSDILKTLLLKFQVCLQVSFWRAPTQADIIE